MALLHILYIPYLLRFIVCYQSCVLLSDPVHFIASYPTVSIELTLYDISKFETHLCFNKVNNPTWDNVLRGGSMRGFVSSIIKANTYIVAFKATSNNYSWYSGDSPVLHMDGWQNSWRLFSVHGYYEESGRGGDGHIYFEGQEISYGSNIEIYEMTWLLLRLQLLLYLDR